MCGARAWASQQLMVLWAPAWANLWDVCAIIMIIALPPVGFWFGMLRLQAKATYNRTAPLGLYQHHNPGQASGGHVAASVAADVACIQEYAAPYKSVWSVSILVAGGANPPVAQRACYRASLSMSSVASVSRSSACQQCSLWRLQLHLCGSGMRD
jgi:hypothetical protein